MQFFNQENHRFARFRTNTQTAANPFLGWLQIKVEPEKVPSCRSFGQYHWLKGCLGVFGSELAGLILVIFRSLKFVENFSFISLGQLVYKVSLPKLNHLFWVWQVVWFFHLFICNKSVIWFFLCLLFYFFFRWCKSEGSYRLEGRLEGVRSCCRITINWTQLGWMTNRRCH